MVNIFLSLMTYDSFFIDNKNDTSIDHLSIENEEIDQQKHLLQNQLIREVALSCFAELAIGSIVTGAACCFMATTLIPNAISILMTTLAINALMHFMMAFIKYHHVVYGGPNMVLCEHLPIGLFSHLDLMTHGTLIHEMGHALTAHWLFENANPKIEIFPEGNGSTSFNIAKLSVWGQKLGMKRSIAIIDAAGTAFALLEATLLLLIAHKIKDQYPKIRPYLTHMAIQRVVYHVFYALSAFAATSDGHDFYSLWKGAGIHPIASAVTIIAIPALAQYALWKFSKTREADEIE